MSFFGEKNRTGKDKLPIAFRKDQHNTWTHGLLWRISLREQVPGGCRLQFEQIAHDVHQYRKPSNKDDIMRSSWFCCYSNCDKFNLFVTVFIRFKKKTVATVPKHLLLCCFNLLRVDLIKTFWIWSGKRAADFQVKTGGDVGSFWSYEIPINYPLNMDWC